MTRYTMKEIARLANVSQPTVSRVLSGNPDVNEEIANRVRQVVESVGYIPNKAAQTLKGNQSFIIGVCVSQIYNPYFVELIDNLENRAKEIGYSIIFHNSKHNPVSEWENIQNFIARQVDGIILVPTGEFNIERIKKLKIPTVVITQSNSVLDSVSLDHIKAGRMAAEYFIKKGHKDFGFIGHPHDEKFIGFESALYENGITFNMENYIEISVNSTYSSMIRKDIEKYFQAHDTINFSCVNTTNDIVAIEFMKAAQDKGIRIPDDVSIIGFDDTYLTSILGLSSIHQPIDTMVKNAIEILQNRISMQLSSDKINILLDPTIIERSSSNYSRAIS